MTARTVRINPATAPAYDVVIGRGCLDELGERLRGLTSRRRAFVVVDGSLPDGLVERAVGGLESAGFEPATSALEAVETRKTIETVSRLLHECALAGLDRGDPVIALGGGMTGDVAGFVGAVYKRGGMVVQCPTTLLAMVDASVGGKTGVNLVLPDNLRKNLVGSFHQPSLVLADPGTLASLPDRQLRAGLGECLKHALIAGEVDPALWGWTIERLDDVRRRDDGVVGELIERNVRVKQRFVEADEHERDAGPGGRMLLNLGHTFGHALEAAPGLSPGDVLAAREPSRGLLHGEAVAYGLIGAAAMGVALGVLEEADAATITRGVGELGVHAPVRGEATPDRLLALMRHDKKAAAGQLRVVAPEAVGRCRVVESPAEGALRAGLGAILGDAR